MEIRLIGGSGFQGSPSFSNDENKIALLNPNHSSYYFDKTQVILYDLESDQHSTLAEDWDRSPFSYNGLMTINS